MSPERKQYCDEDYVDRLMSSLVDPLKYDLGETLKCNAEEIEQCD